MIGQVRAAISAAREGVPGDPATPARSLPAQTAIYLVTTALSLGIALIGDQNLFRGLDGFPVALRVADAVCGVAAYIALWWRRRYPVAFAAGVLVVWTFSTLAGGLGFAAAFTVAVHRRWQVSVVASVLLAASVWPSIVIYDRHDKTPWETFLLTTVIMFATTGWGMFIRARRELVGSLRIRAERAEQGREEHAAQARVAERQRIAREMHDVLAHRLSLLSVQAGALEVAADAEPAELAQAAGAVRSTTHQALAELRSIVRLLRADGDDDTGAPQPVATDLPALLTESGRAASVRLDHDGVDLAAVPAGVGRTLYRIVQEGLTNARKHAPGSAVEVTLTGSPAAGLSLVISSWLPVGRAVPPVAPGSGAGLIGLRERAVLSGGRLDVKVTGDDRFQLLAWLPWEGP